MTEITMSLVNKDHTPSATFWKASNYIWVRDYSITEIIIMDSIYAVLRMEPSN